MKAPLLNTLVAAGVILCGSHLQASDNLILERHAQTLACLASDMESAFRDDLREMHRHYPPSRAELRFQQSLCQLASVAGQFRLGVTRCAEACEIERAFESLQEVFECVEECSDDVRVCSEIRSAMCRFEKTLDCVEEVGFEIASHRHREFDHRHGHHHERLQGSNTGSIEFRVPLPQGLPFVFRQPLR